MALRLNPEILPAVQRTKLADAVVVWLEKEKRAVVTPYALFLGLRRLYTPENRRKLYLRSDVATTDALRRVTINLLRSRGIEVDPDYGRKVYRVPSVGESSADEVCALANPFGYISHLSAMQRWGLTERRPEALHLTMPRAGGVRPLIEQRMAADYGAPIAALPLGQAVRLHFIRHPDAVRGRKLSVYETKHLGQWLQVRDSHARLATIGQTFVNMVEWPQYCGGMAHVLDVWRGHANIYREDIIAAVDEVASPIAKVRAGYLLDDMLALGDDLRIQGWVRFAQRGSSRVLDPSKDFSADHSEKWMLSINV
jgi:predicted transcriptional regulator of viral defense system